MGGDRTNGVWCAAIARGVELVRADAARWIRPEEVAELSEVTPTRFARLWFRHLPLRALVWFRAAQVAQELGVRGIGGFVQRHLLTRYGLELAPTTPVGGGLYIAHPVGCVLHARSIGTNVTVVGAATFGTRDDGRWPTIGDDVYVGIGARVLGGVSIGDGATIGANAVVLADVEAAATVVGAPARPVGARRSPTAVAAAAPELTDDVCGARRPAAGESDASGATDAASTPAMNGADERRPGRP